MNNNIESLRQLYAQSSKHADYQEMAPSLRSAIGIETKPTKSRCETERWEFISRHCDFRGARVMDIGGNTGYFTFQALAAGASHVRYVEGNKAHAEFVQLASKVVDRGDAIQVENRYYDFPNPQDAHADVAFLLNVVHHFGDDFGSADLDLQRAKVRMIEYVNAMAGVAQTLVFQMGFCWKGNRHLPIFPRGTKEEMMGFLKEGTGRHWSLVTTGVAEQTAAGVSYKQPNAGNLLRFDGLGEFLNRPIFIFRRTT